MSTVKKIIIGCFFSICLFSIFMTTNSYAKTNEEFKIQKYVYPDIDNEKIKTDGPDKIKKNINNFNGSTKNMNTKQLVELLANYPYLIDFQLFDSTEQALNAVSNKFEPLKTLLTRNDFVDELSKYYSRLNENIKSLDKTDLTEYDLTALHIQAMTIKDILKYYGSTPDRTILSNNSMDIGRTTLLNSSMNIDREYNDISSTIESIKNTKFKSSDNTSYENNSAHLFGAADVIYTPKGSAVNTIYTAPLTTTQYNSIRVCEIFSVN